MNSTEIHFIISAPRSGSTWLARALNQHPEILATEHRFFGDFCELWRNNDGSSSPRITLDAYTKAFSTHYFYEELDLTRAQFVNQLQRNLMTTMIRFGASRSGKRVVVDKITPYPGTAQFVLSQIKRFFPTAKVIQLIRDGRDVATSGTFDWLLKDAQGTDRYRYFVDKTPGFKLTRFFDDQVLSRWADIWRESIDVFTDSPADLQVTYEQMIADQASALRSIFRLLDVDDSRSVATHCADSVSFQKLTGRPAGQMEATAKERKAIVGDWMNFFTQTDCELFDQIAGAELVSCGYERDSSWLQATPRELGLPGDWD